MGIIQARQRFKLKLNYLISQLPEVDSLFIFPSCGDESNPIGACILAAINHGFPYEAIKPLGFRWVSLDLEGYRMGSLNPVAGPGTERGA